MEASTLPVRVSVWRMSRQLIGDRITKYCGKTEAELLKFCQLQMVVVQEKLALMIRCPNT